MRSCDGSTWLMVCGGGREALENDGIGTVVNRGCGPGLCLRVVKMPWTGLCRITFSGADGKGDGIILSRCLICSSSRRSPGKKCKAKRKPQRFPPRSVEQQIRRTGGNSNGGALFGKSGKVAVKRRKRVADNPATSGNNPPGGDNRKSKMISRKSLKGKANSVPESITETLGRIKVKSLATWNRSGRIGIIIRKDSSV